MDKVMSLIAFAVLVAFLAILAAYVTEIDLIAVIGLTLVLAGYDVITSGWKKRD